MRTQDRLTDLLLGSVVTLLTAPTGLGPAVGGWFAGRRAENLAGGGLAAGVAGLAGSLPWAGLVYLAASGSIDPIGYHEGFVHVGVNPAAPETLVLWQEVGLTALVLVAFVAVAVGGGLVAASRTDVASEVREDLERA